MSNSGRNLEANLRRVFFKPRPSLRDLKYGKINLRLNFKFLVRNRKKLILGTTFDKFTKIF